MTKNALRRYTNLASTLHILRNRQLTLLSPETWDDRNDAFFMSEYRRLRNVKTVLAICLADRGETYHHWQVFSRGSDGVCIEFDRRQLLAAFSRVEGLNHRRVEYALMSTASSMNDVDLEILPFTKRWAYGDEREYRAVFVSSEEELTFFPVAIELASIKRITLSPWLAPGLVHAVKETLNSLPGCGDLKVTRSTLIDNKKWQKLTGRVVPTPSVPFP